MKKILRIFGYILLTLMAVYYIVLPLGITLKATSSAKKGTGKSPNGFVAQSIKTTDNITLSAWYSRPKNGKAIILVHGAGGHKASMQKYAMFFVKQSYGVLSIDLRGHGESEGKTNRFGWQGTKDIGAAVEFLKKQTDVKTILGFGSSMGGEVLLGAASAYPEIKGIISDGATFRSFDEFMAVNFTSPLVQSTSYIRMVDIFTGLLLKEKTPLPLTESINSAKSTKFFFIAAENNSNEVTYNQSFEKIVSNRATLWIAPRSNHTQAYKKNKADFEKKVIAFYNSVS